MAAAIVVVSQQPRRFSMTNALPFTSLDHDVLDQVSGGVDWGQAFNSAKTGAEVVGGAGAAVGAVAGGAIGAGAGAVAVPGIGAVPGWVAGGAAGAGIGAAFGGAVGYAGGLAKGIYDTWGK
jgi:hypothetical protein